MKRKYIIGLIILVLLTSIVFRLATNKRILDEKNKPAQDSTVRIPVKAVEAKEQLLSVDLIKTGTLLPFKEARVLSTISGTVQLLRFELGDHIKEGQVLAMMDTRLAQLDLQRAESNAARLSRDLQTYTELLAGQAATEEKVSEVRQSYLDAANQVSQIKKQIADAAVKAATSGTISEKLIEQGVFASAGTQIATIVNLSQAKVQINLTEAEVYLVRQGQPVKISSDVNPGIIFNGKITFISPQADATHNYRLEVSIANNENNPLRSGTFVYVDFSRKTTQTALFVPREAITQSVKEASVYVVENNAVSQRAVRTGVERAGMVQIISGLKQGETVITSGQINLKEGSLVSISK